MRGQQPPRLRQSSQQFAWAQRLNAERSRARGTSLRGGKTVFNLGRAPGVRAPLRGEEFPWGVVACDRLRQQVGILENQS